MTIQAAIRLGETANLISGFAAIWDRNDEHARPYYASQKQALQTVDVPLPDNTGTWGYPIISLHEDNASLISKLYDYQVLPYRSDDASFKVPSGSLVLGEKDEASILKQVGAYVGLDLTKGQSYMLVRIERHDGQVDHEFTTNFGAVHRDDYWTPEAKAAYGQEAEKLSTLPVFTLEQAQSTLAFGYDYGTHFVSSVSIGDVIFQVFALDKAEFGQLQAAFKQDADSNGEVTDLNALNYQYYTTPVNEVSGQKYGFIAQYGSIVSFSQDAALAASIKSGAWNDEKHNAGSSIFMAYDYAKNGVGFLKPFKKQTVTSISLLPLASLATVTDWAAFWDRITSGALQHKYGSTVQLSFPSETTPKGSLFPDASGDWLSVIATPTIDLYQDYVDLSQVNLVNTEAVESFRLFSQLLNIGRAGTNPVSIPGQQVRIISYAVDTSSLTPAPILRLTPKAFTSLQFVIGNMTGALTFEAADGSGRAAVLDGLAFADDETGLDSGRLAVKIAADYRKPPADDILAEASANIHFSLVAAESHLYGRGANAQSLRQFTRSYLTWLESLISVETDNVELIALRTQASYLGKVSTQLDGPSVTVPYLTYESYQNYVRSMIDVANELSDTQRDYQIKLMFQKQADLTIKTAQQLNENLKKTGSVLTDYVGSVARYQSDMANQYQLVIEQKKKELDKGITDLKKLGNLLAEQQDVVKDKVSDFKKAMVAWEVEQVIKFCVDIATDLFKLGTSFMIPASEIKEVLKLGETAQKIQKVLNVINALMKLEQDIEKNIYLFKGVSNALSMLGSELQMPSSREWQELSINFEASLATVPSDPGPQKAKADLVAAFKILVLRGQAWLDASSKVNQLNTDIFYNQRLQVMNQKQADRLSEISRSLHLNDIQTPEISSIDLVGLTGQVQFQMKQVMAMLARTLIMQDAAVQYEYLGEPANISRFDLASVKQVMAAQQQNIINALNLLNPTPKPVSEPIVYRIKSVPVSLLTNGSIYSFIIQPSASEFRKYSMVRIDKVVANIEGIASSDTGEYLIELDYQGDPFEDRDQHGRMISFQTVRRYMGPYDYRIRDGKALFGDQTGAFDRGITHVTPFSTWNISLPDSPTNAGLCFDGPTVDITLTFHITALLTDQKKPMLLADAPGSGGGATLENLLDNMYQNQAVLKGWDVVFNLREEPVNKFLKAQYDAKHGTEGMPPIVVGFCQKFPNPVDDGWIAAYTKVSVTLDTPLLQFETNNHDYVTVFQNVLSGYTQSGSKVVDESFDPVKDCNLDDPEIHWKSQQPIDVSNKPYIQGSVALSFVSGLVQSSKNNDKTYTIVLDFRKGSFTAQQLKVNTNNAMLNQQLSNYFQTTEILYQINTLDLNNITTLPSLTPTSFKLNVLTTNSKRNVLQVFITTNGTQQDNLTINVNEPIPEAYDCSLMVNTRIMFRDIFVQSFNKGSTNITVAAVDPKQDFKAWSATATGGTVVGTVDFGDDSKSYRMNPSNNNINWDITGLTFSPNKMNGISLNYSKQLKIDFQHRNYHYTQYGGYWGSWNDHSVNVTFTMTGYYPIKVGGSGKLQTIQIDSEPPSVDIDNSSLKPTGPCECNDNTLQIRVKDGMRKDIPGAIKNQMAGIKFQAVSIFALENLLFPAENFIEMDSAYVPGDLVILGHFKQFTDDEQ
ncbi:hypothetical protein [Paenibacillus xylaniclasticus]|uniref:hypothetical protein n=1 Tax=Paenibacillus xylaniclasticus TaxID=588083 RepID=UPI000FDB88E1|nr:MULTISPECIES: hypothetical protein [Paenibacillus]GFN31702.1 hypothetical protein PCURB6_19620 [Paenibacillus curdlanolyticus]